MSLSKRKLVEKTVFLFEEGKDISRMMVELLLKGKSQLCFDEVLHLSERVHTGKEAEDLAREALLSMEEWRILLPSKIKCRGSIAWEDRINLPRLGETYEIPPCITFAFNQLKSEGEWNWRSSVRKYLEVIEQPHKGTLLSVIDENLNNLFLSRFISAETIRRACVNHGFDEHVNLLIAELKGGGIISPCLSCSLFSKKIFANSVENLSDRGPFYELNKGLFALELKEKHL